MIRQKSILVNLIRAVSSILLVALVVSVAPTAEAKGPMGRDFGLGFAAGNPSSFTGKYYLSSEEAFDFHIGLYKAYNRGFYDDTIFLAGDYLFEVWNFVENGTVSLPFYAGPGVALLFDTDDDVCGRFRRNDIYCDDFDFGFGPRMPLGIAVQFQKAPFEIFLEMAPTLLFIINENDIDGDDLDVDIDIVNFSLGGRFYF